ncbi:MAG: hypothetical protein JWL85_858 [Candidatus Saccharibacteria bacterium]|nr:hypothetical protein [Candidatus Saccharibacteria bacterium]
MRPSDLLICCFVRPYAPGDTFKEWPLHVTIIPWINGDRSPEELAQALAEALTGIKPFEVVVGPEAWRNRQRRLVNLIVEPTPFTEVYEIAKKVVGQLGFRFLTKLHSPFKPHISAQKGERLHEGDTFICNAVYIIEQKGSYKEIVGKVRLS